MDKTIEVIAELGMIDESNDHLINRLMDSLETTYPNDVDKQLEELAKMLKDIAVASEISFEGVDFINVAEAFLI